MTALPIGPIVRRTMPTRTMPTNAEMRIRTSKVWQVLIARATNRQTLTYGDLAKSIGHPRLGLGIGPCLDRIADYCRRNGLPPLWVIVVNQETGRSSQEPENVGAERERVYAHPWFTATPYNA